MIKFLRHKKFWMPFLLVLLLALLLEVLLRFNLWDNMIKPRSFLGNALYREQALRDFGLEKVHWITVGDSKSDWGLEHQAILNVQKINGNNHLRLSFESSNFMAIQATVDWSIANMPNLKGIMLGISEDSVSHLSDVTTQYNVAWQFRNYYDDDKYQYFEANYQSYAYITSLASYVYHKDIKNFIMNMSSRIKAIDRYQLNTYKNIFNYSRHLSGNICDFSLDSIQQCVQMAESFNKKQAELNGAEQFIKANCGNDNIKSRVQVGLANYSISKIDMQHRINNWQGLFNTILGHNLKLKVMVLPESVMYDYVIRPENAEQILLTILDGYKMHEKFEILDLRNIFKQQPGLEQCQYYHDPIHFNNKGKALLTQKVVASFVNVNNTSIQIEVKKTKNRLDKINNNSFENN